jgi:hypothetical protein
MNEANQRRNAVDILFLHLSFLAFYTFNLRRYPLFFVLLPPTGWLLGYAVAELFVGVTQTA